MPNPKPNFIQVLKAVIGAFIGVQSEQQRLQDFQSHSAVPYIVTALIVASIFVGLLLLVVYLVLN